MSTVNKILQSSSSYVERELPCNEDLASAMDNYTVDRVRISQTTVHFVIIRELTSKAATKRSLQNTSY